jgi:hypothetical protein
LRGGAGKRGQAAGKNKIDILFYEQGEKKMRTDRIIRQHTLPPAPFPCPF